MADRIDHRAEAKARLLASDSQRQHAAEHDGDPTGAMHEAAMATAHAVLDLADAVRSRPAADVSPGSCPSTDPLSGVAMFGGSPRLPQMFCDLRAGHQGDHERLPNLDSGYARWSDRDQQTGEVPAP